MITSCKTATQNYNQNVNTDKIHQFYLDFITLPTFACVCVCVCVCVCACLVTCNFITSVISCIHYNGQDKEQCHYCHHKDPSC